MASATDPFQILVVVSGHVVVGYISPASGGSSAFALVGPGQVLGFVRSLDDLNGVMFDFVAHDKVTAVHMPVLLAIEILDREPMLWKSMMPMLLRQHREAMDAMLDHLAGPLQQRLAATIKRLAKLYGTKFGGTTRLQLRLTQEDLGAILQATRQSVNRELKLMAASGVISVEYNAVTVLDATALGKIARESTEKSI